MAEREIVIKISAKNLTTAEFQKVQKGLVGVGNSATGANKKTASLKEGFRDFRKVAGRALGIVAAAATAAAAAVVGITVAVIKLGERGAAVGDVQSAFESLSMRVGETGQVMLTSLAKGVKGTISNFDLMKVANKALGTGLLKTSSDARTLSEGARLLAKRTGSDTVQAFETLVTAMASGRTAQLKQIGLFVDNKQAIEDYAEATGKTVSEINDADRATALQIATMAALRKELESFPPPLSDFGELIERGRVGVKNLVDEFAVMISNSPVLLEGMKAAGDAISRAFGDDKQALLRGIVGIIEEAAFVALEFGKVSITAAIGISRGFGIVKSVVGTVSFAFSEMNTLLLETTATSLAVSAAMSGYDETLSRLALDARAAANASAAHTLRLKEGIVESVAAAEGTDAWGLSLRGIRIGLEETQLAMVTGRLAQEGSNQATAAAVVHTTNLSTAAAGVKAALEAFLPSIDLSRTSIVELGNDTAVAADLMNTKFDEIVAGQQIVQSTFASTGVQIGGVASSIQAAFARMGVATRAELAATAKQAKKDFETIEKSGKATFAELQKAREKSEEAQRLAMGTTTEFTMTSNQAVLAGTTTMLSALGGKFKAAAMANAIILTAQAVLQALGSSPPPGSWILAAANAAAGAIQIAKIAGVGGFREGTDRLDFQDFGVSRPAVLHGREAVIPQGGGHLLAREIAGAMRGSQRPDGALVEELGNLRASIDRLDSLPRTLQRAIRDGVLLAN